MKEFNINTKIRVYTIDECSQIEKNLIEAAKTSCMNAYVPYSNFHVGAAVLFEDGEIMSGNNQENAAYPSGTCAERTTLFFANANFPNRKIVAMSVAAFYKGRFTKDVITPCGACRQVILEVENRFKTPIKLYLYSDEEIYVLDSIKDILPLNFGEEMLR